LSKQDNERMAKLYRQHVLKEPVAETPPLVQIKTGRKPKAHPQAQGDAAASVSGD
jgi:hypothetical protein